MGIHEALWQANPNDIDTGEVLSDTLIKLGDLLSNAGQTGPAEGQFRRSVDILKALWRASPSNVVVGDGLGRSLSNLGILLNSTGQTGPAQCALRSSAEIFASTVAGQPDSPRAEGPIRGKPLQRWAVG